jgi:hypothetical protein
MLGIRTSMIAVVMSLVMNGAGAAGCDRKDVATQNVNTSKNSNAQTPPQPEPSVPGKEQVVNGEIKVLAEGQYSRVGDAFVAVARDAETYAALRAEFSGLPEVSADSFKTNALIAAFSGARRTGGYGVAITRSANGSLRVSSTSPPPDSMVTQQLTSPFKLASVTLDIDQPLMIELDNTWQVMTRPYRVTTGEFTQSGGFAGRSEKFQPTGSIGIMRQGKLATLFFDLKSAGGGKARALKETATGVVQSDGRIKLSQFSAGTFVDLPKPPLRATGQFTDKEDNLSLTFESLPTNVADGYMGSGTLEATATAPAIQRKPTNDEL